MFIFAIHVMGPFWRVKELGIIVVVQRWDDKDRISVEPLGLEMRWQM